MSKMAEEAYLEDSYGNEDYIRFLEDKLELIYENNKKTGVKDELKRKKKRDHNINSSDFLHLDGYKVDKRHGK